MNFFSFLRKTPVSGEWFRDIHEVMSHLSWSFLGIFFNSGIIFGVNVFFGRMFGPEEYGKYTFIITLGYIFSVFILAGQDYTAVRYACKKGSEHGIKISYFSNALFIVFLGSLFVFMAFLLVVLMFPSVFGGNVLIWFLAILFAITLAFKMMADVLYRIFHLFKSQAKGKIAEGLFIVVTFALFVSFFRNFGYFQFVAILCLGAILFSIFGFFLFAKSFSRSVVFDRLNETRSYSWSAFWASLLAILSVTVDKIIVGKYLGMEILGTYGAYITSSVVLVTQATNVCSNVLFPLLSGKENVQTAIKKTDFFSAWCFVPGVVILAVATGMVFSLFGKSFVFSWYYAMLFSISGMAQFLTSLYRNIVLTRKRAFRNLQYFGWASLGLFFVTLIFSAGSDEGVFLKVTLCYGLYSIVSLFVVRGVLAFSK